MRDATLSVLLAPTHANVGETVEFDAEVSDAWKIYSDLKATINWGDQTSSDGEVVATGDGKYVVKETVSPGRDPHRYASAGSYLLTVQVNAKSNTRFGVAYSTALVAPKAVESVWKLETPPEIKKVLPDSWNVNLGTLSPLTEDASLDGYGVSIDWGNGSVTAATLEPTESGAGWSIRGTSPNLSPGTYTIRVTLKKDASILETKDVTYRVKKKESLLLDVESLVVDASTIASKSLKGRVYSNEAFPADAAVTVDFGSGPVAAAWQGQAVNGWRSFSVALPALSTGSHTARVVVAGTELTTAETRATVVVDAAAARNANAWMLPAPDLKGYQNGLIASRIDFMASVSFSGLEVEFDWGDGTPKTVIPAASIGQIGAAGAESRSVFGNHAYQYVGNYVVRATLRVAGSSPQVLDTVLYKTAVTVPAKFELKLDSKIVDLAAPGSPPILTGSFAWDDGVQRDRVAVFIDWGNGTTSKATFGSLTNGYQNFSAAIPNYAPGTYLVSARVEDGNLQPGQSFATVVVQNGAFVADPDHHFGTIEDQTATAGTAASFNVPFVTTDLATDFAVTFDWGDGSSIDVASGEGSTTGSAQGAHTYTSPGEYLVRATLVRPDPSNEVLDSILFKVVVKASPVLVATPTPLSIAPNTRSATAGVELKDIVVATFNDRNPAHQAAWHTATINWGDGAQTAGKVDSEGIHGTHTYASLGSYAVTVTLADATGHSAKYSHSILVSALTPNLVMNPLMATAGVPFDDLVLGTLTSPGSLPSSSSFVVNWGDGTGTSSVTTKGSASQQFVFGSHAYAHPGRYLVQVSSSGPGGFVKEQEISVVALQAGRASDLRLGTFFDPSSGTYSASVSDLEPDKFHNAFLPNHTFADAGPTVVSQTVTRLGTNDSVTLGRDATIDAKPLESLGFAYATAASGSTVTLEVKNSSGLAIRSIEWTLSGAKDTFVWDGKDGSDNLAPAGVYTYVLTITNGATSKTASGRFDIRESNGVRSIVSRNTVVAGSSLDAVPLAVFSKTGANGTDFSGHYLWSDGYVGTGSVDIRPISSPSDDGLWGVFTTRVTDSLGLRTAHLSIGTGAVSST
ncbi:MAG: FlgD immunoglobulin-like domain containing protein [Gemmataceae bacterium]